MKKYYCGTLENKFKNNWLLGNKDDSWQRHVASFVTKRAYT